MDKNAVPGSSGTPDAIRLVVPPLWRNWISYFGLLIGALSLFCFLLLVAIDLTSGHGGNAYVGVLAYLVAPVFGSIGCGLIVAGMFLKRLSRRGMSMEQLQEEAKISKPTDFRLVALFAVVAFFLTIVSAYASYTSYHFTESVEFCGTACHEVMQPEYTAYQHGSHARVACSECHIGAGAQWYIKAKLSGLHQVWAVFTGEFNRPILTPIKNLRPAADTCEQCHWPAKFVGNMDRTYYHFLTEGDEPNEPWAIRLILKVGGGDPTNGPVGGIHWHMNVNNKIEYVATDRQRQRIPWVRVTDPKGVVTEYRSPDFKDDPTKDPAKYEIRRMDCMDCHNRPAHVFKSPHEAVDKAMEQGLISPKLIDVKATAVEILNKDYATEDEAMKAIEAGMKAKFANDPLAPAAIAEVQEIYHRNFFPKMKASWIDYPANIGHKDWPGCMRCHDGDHATTDGQKSITKDCKACHVTLAQGKDVEKITPDVKFKHPGGSMGGQLCYECHNEKWADKFNGVKKPEEGKSEPGSTDSGSPAGASSAAPASPAAASPASASPASASPASASPAAASPAASSPSVK